MHGPPYKQRRSESYKESSALALAHSVSAGLSHRTFSVFRPSYRVKVSGGSVGPVLQPGSSGFQVENFE